MLPVGYFHVVYTLPARLRDVAFQNKRVIYHLVMKAAAAVMATASITGAPVVLPPAGPTQVTTTKIKQELERSIHTEVSDGSDLLREGELLRANLQHELDLAERARLKEDERLKHLRELLEKWTDLAKKLRDAREDREKRREASALIQQMRTVQRPPNM